jgi:predicted transcriptional regulator
VKTKQERGRRRMSGNEGNVFDKIQQTSNVNKETIFKLADSVKDANFKDEETVRQLVRQIAVLAGRTVSKEKENQIVKAVITNNMPLDFASLGNMFKK